MLDNYPEGRVYVWWVDGHVSMCWPQDLYKVGDYDSDEGELWDDGSSEGSWETESEGSFIAEEEIIDQSIKPKLAANIEKARIAMSRLEELFTQNPALQTLDIMKKLLEVYKDCRYLDKLMGTSFFHENNFQGLLERVREKGRASVGSKVAEQVSRLFQNPSEGSPMKTPQKECEKLIVSYELEVEDGNINGETLPEAAPPPALPTCLVNEGKSDDSILAADETKENTSDEIEKNKILVNNELNNEKTKKTLDFSGEVTEDIERVNKTIDSLSVTLDKKILEQKMSEQLEVIEMESPGMVRLKSTTGLTKINDEKSEGSFKSGNSEDEFSNSTEKSPISLNGQMLQSSSADDSGVFEHSSISAEVPAVMDNCDCLVKTNFTSVPRPPTLQDVHPAEEKVTPESKKGTYIFGAMGTRSMHIQSDKRTNSKIKYQSQTSLPSHAAEKDHYFDTNSNDPNASQVCAKLCALIKSQLVKAHAEVRTLKHFNCYVWGAFNFNFLTFLCNVILENEGFKKDS